MHTYAEYVLSSVFFVTNFNGSAAGEKNGSLYTLVSQLHTRASKVQRGEHFLQARAVEPAASSSSSNAVRGSFVGREVGGGTKLGAPRVTKTGWL